MLFESYESSSNQSGIFRQRLDSTTSEPFITGHDRVRFIRDTPDGKWLYYVRRQAHGDPGLMRMLPSGGPPQVVWSNPSLDRHLCTTSPVSFYVAAVRQKTRMVFYPIDPGEDPRSGGFRDKVLRELSKVSI